MIQTDLPGRVIEAVMFACVAALLMPAAATAEDDALRTSLSEEDHRLINVSNMEYNRCLQEQAMSHADNYKDVRAVAGRAVEECTGILDGLETHLDEQRIDPGYYGGILRSIKSRAIRQVLPGIMMYKAQGDATNP